ncbi:unnamed protein product, partial [Candidula unifasciata]
TTTAREWQKEVMKTITRDHKYVIISSIQLVGVVLYVFVRPQLAPFIRDVAVDKVKTGLGGATGNKGGVAIRFVLNSTSICFVCAHLAAGQKEVNERNANYTEITRKMSFPMGRTILSHDCVFWCGDFNYRVDLSNEEVKSLVASENWSALQEMDQLNLHRAQNNAFQGFSEGPLNFAPTYKYDTFSDDYDTSDKGRTPAWTDRVLWKVKVVKDPETEEELSHGQVKLLMYTRAELRTSDHRPVVALFDVDTLVTIEEKRNATLSKVISEQGPPDGTVVISTVTGEELSDEAVEDIVTKFREVGDIVIVRFVGSDMWILFQYGQFALEALQFDQQQFAGTTIRVRLKTTEWRNEIEKELNLCSSSSGALYNQFSNSLLGDDFSVPSMEFDMEEDEGDETADVEVENTLQANSAASGTNTHSGHSSPALQGEIPGGPPTNPPRPVAPPAHSTGTQPRAPSPGMGWDGQVVRDVTPQFRASPVPENKQPPARPSAPPVKPPPPQRPPGGPPKPSPTHSASGLSQPSASGAPNKPVPPRIRQPLRPAPSDKSKAKKSQKIGQIGLPTNVTHHGHASSIEEAQVLIQKLLSTESEQKSTGIPLPTPLIPSKSETNLSAVAGGLLAPKVLPRSHTAQEIGDNAHSLQPQPVPRQRSVDNIHSGHTGTVPSDNISDTTSSSRPRPTPRVQSSIIDGDSLSDSVHSRNPPSPSHRPGSVQMSATAANGQTVPFRTAPPLPETKPAPPPTELKHPTAIPASAAAPTPPARPSRPSEKVVSKPSEPVDSFSTSSSGQLGSHLLDRENSITGKAHEDSDPFNTEFARFPPTAFRPQPSLPDPFDTRHISNRTEVAVASDQANKKSIPDPFNTDHVAQNSQAFDDPFLTTSHPFNHPSSDAQNTSSSVDSLTLSEQSLSLPSATSNDFDQSESFGESAFQAPDMSPPPLPSDIGAPRFTPTPVGLSCPLEDPPPAPAGCPPALPAPNRPGGVPPPVPRRPV